MAGRRGGDDAKESPKETQEARYRPVPRTEDDEVDVRELLKQWDDDVNNG